MLKLEATNKNVEQCMNLTNYSNELTQKRIIDLRAANEAIHAEVHDKSRKIQKQIDIIEEQFTIVQDQCQKLMTSDQIGKFKNLMQVKVNEAMI
jgi:hypothetical protein